MTYTFEQAVKSWQDTSAALPELGKRWEDAKHTFDERDMASEDIFHAYAEMGYCMRVVEDHFARLIEAELISG